jgi:hypothetical protein
MATPRWKEPTLGLERAWGFDGTAVPAWFMVPHTPGIATKTLRLDFASGKLVRSINPRVASLVEEAPDPVSRFFGFRGRTPGRARIEVRDPKTNALESVLEVSVKGRLNLRISFHFVEDKAGDRTIRQPDIVEGLIDELNSIYEDQTNIRFSEGSGGDVKLDLHLNDVVTEEMVAKTKRLTGEALLLGKSAWNQIFAKKRDRLADFNIFFVPTDEPVNTNRNALPYTDSDGNCVIEDGREGLDMILPHAVGRMLGCPFTTDPNHIQQLMFWDDTIRRTGNFIPKACANIMNPSGR